MAQQSVKIGISSCLLGNNVRYDGGQKLDLYLRYTLGRFVEWIPVCPEVECGLSVPREAMGLVGDPDSPRLVTKNTGIEHTDRLMHWTNKKLKKLEQENFSGFVFKARSPSCGVHDAKLYSLSGKLVAKRAGLFAGNVLDQFPFMPIEDEERLHDPVIRENFIERLFVYHRWREFLEGGRTTGRLIEFHARHKYVLMSHSVKHLKELGSLVANPGKHKPAALFEIYIRIMMQGLKLPATASKHVNVLQHLAGYFKKQLSHAEKTELADLISRYSQGLVPLLAPITLINHYAGMHDDAYLKQQHYLNPHPLELVLRNHA